MAEWTVGSGKPIPVTDPADQQRVERLHKLAALTGPANETQCALCGSSKTTADVYSIGRQDNATSASADGGDFHLCASCAVTFIDDMEALKRLGQTGTQ